MSADNALNGQQFFHGTAHDVGKRVVPADQSGREVHPGKRTLGGRRAGTVAFATTSEKQAWDFADMAASHAVTNASGNIDQSRTRPRARVYEVHPHEESKAGLYNSAHPRFRKNSPRIDHEEYVAPHWDVKAQHDIQPGQQGTFPQLNWNQFAIHQTWDTNHPSHDEIDHGHMGSSLAKESRDKFFGTVEGAKADRAAKDLHERTQMKLF